MSSVCIGERPTSISSSTEGLYDWPLIDEMLPPSAGPHPRRRIHISEGLADPSAAWCGVKGQYQNIRTWRLKFQGVMWVSSLIDTVVNAAKARRRELWRQKGSSNTLAIYNAYFYHPFMSSSSLPPPLPFLPMIASRLPSLPRTSSELQPPAQGEAYCRLVNSIPLPHSLVVAYPFPIRDHPSL